VESAGEFGLLSVLLGNRDGTIEIADMRRLFEANELSAGARENLGSRTAEEWLELTRRITEAVSAAAAGARDRRPEMKSGQLKDLLEVLFSPLLRTHS
jgi:hypothetical protein